MDDSEESEVGPRSFQLAYQLPYAVVGTRPSQIRGLWKPARSVTDWLSNIKAEVSLSAVAQGAKAEIAPHKCVFRAFLAQLAGVLKHYQDLLRHYSATPVY